MAQSVQRKVPRRGSSIQCPQFKPNPVSLKKGFDEWHNQSQRHLPINSPSATQPKIYILPLVQLVKHDINQHSKTHTCNIEMSPTFIKLSGRKKRNRPLCLEHHQRPGTWQMSAMSLTDGRSNVMDHWNFCNRIQYVVISIWVGTLVVVMVCFDQQPWQM